ncbi:MAG: hypothetical protein KC910_01425 [Candidatus Eremiobacteraeota bacterium]|nr:hypothetical protein [Candidatus Eremiobacteraeota bacterium]
MMKSRGMSLVECVIAIFFLLTGLAVVTALFHTTYQRKVQAGQRSEAALLAHRRLTEIQEWARGSGAAYNFDDWSSLADQTMSYPESPTFSIRTRSAPRQLFSPSSQLESSYPAGQQRVMAASAYTVEVTVTWGSNGRYRLVSVVADPARRITPVVNGTFTNPVGPGQTAVFTTTINDEFGNRVSDIFVDWQMVSMGGIGSWQSIDRDGATARLVTGTGTAGQCRVEASVRYDGVTTRVASGVMDLTP